MVSPGLKNGFPAEMYVMAERDYYKGSNTAFQDGIKNYERSFNFVEDYYSHIVIGVTSFEFEGMAVSGVTRALGNEVAWKAAQIGKHASNMTKLADVNGKIAKLGMTNKAASDFFGWENGYNIKTVADFTRSQLEKAGITKEILTELMEAYHQVAQYSHSNPSAYVRFQQLKEILTLF